MVLNASFGSFFYGYELTVLNTSEEKLSRYFQWSKEEQTSNISLCTSLIPTGALIFSFIGGYLAKSGRRRALIITDVFSIIGVILQLLSLQQLSFGLFIISRILLGCSCGLCVSLVPLYIKEMSPKTISGRTGMFHQISVIMAMVISSLIGLKLGKPEDTHDIH